MSKTILIVLALILAACNAAPTPTPLPTALSNQLSKQVPGTAPAGTQVLLVQSVTAVGLNRFAIGLQRGDSFVKGATLTMSFYDLTGQKEKLVDRPGSLPRGTRWTGWHLHGHDELSDGWLVGTCGQGN